MACIDFLLKYSGGQGDNIDITSDVVSINASAGADARAGQLKINYKATSSWDNYFTANDSIELYLKKGRLNKSKIKDMYTNNPNDLIISSKVKSINYNTVEGKDVLTIDCTDKTEVLNSLLFARYLRESDGRAVAISDGDENDSIVHLLVKNINDALEWDGTSDEILMDSAYIDTTDLPEGKTGIDYASVFKGYGEILKELSSGEYTKGKLYSFWIDSKNYFHYKEKTTAVTGSVIQGTDDLIQHKMTKDVFDVINAMIFNAGSDLNGNGIWWYAVNSISASEVGFRWDFRSDINIEKKALTEVYDDNGTSTDVGERYLEDTTQSWTINEWADSYLITDNRKQTFLIVSNTADTLTLEGSPSGGDYYIYNGTNADYRTEIKALVKGVVLGQLADTAELRYKGTLELQGVNTYAINGVYEIQIPALGWTSTNKKKLRLTDIGHNLQKGSWFVTLNVKEDVTLVE